MMLTQQERDRFASWLEVEAETSRGLLEQMAKLPGLGPAMERERLELAAALVIARKLRATESQSIGGQR